MSLTPEEIAEVRKALAGVPDSDVRHALALMEDVPASMEVPDAIVAFYTAVGTAANALWQARCSALKTALDQAIADREEAIVERDAVRASQSITKASLDSALAILAQVRKAVELG